MIYVIYGFSLASTTFGYTLHRYHRGSVFLWSGRHWSQTSSPKVFKNEASATAEIPKSAMQSLPST